MPNIQQTVVLIAKSDHVAEAVCEAVGYAQDKLGQSFAVALAIGEKTFPLSKRLAIAGQTPEKLVFSILKEARQQAPETLLPITGHSKFYYNQRELLLEPLGGRHVTEKTIKSALKVAENTKSMPVLFKLRGETHNLTSMLTTHKEYEMVKILMSANRGMGHKEGIGSGWQARRLQKPPLRKECKLSDHREPLIFLEQIHVKLFGFLELSVRILSCNYIIGFHGNAACHFCAERFGARLE